MKKSSFLVLVLVVNFSLLSCTVEDLSEVTEESLEFSATGDGEDGKDSDEEPPPGGSS